MWLASWPTGCKPDLNQSRGETTKNYLCTTDPKILRDIADEWKEHSPPVYIYMYIYIYVSIVLMVG